MSAWNSMLPKTARFSPPRITVAVTEQTARKALKIKEPNPIIWNGIPLHCIGSKRWRRRIWEIRKLPPVSDKAPCEGCRKRVALITCVCDHCLELAGLDRNAPPSNTSSEGQP